MFNHPWQIVFAVYLVAGLILAWCEYNEDKLIFPRPHWSLYAYIIICGPVVLLWTAITQLHKYGKEEDDEETEDR